MPILEISLEKLFDKNEETVRLVYCSPGGGGGGVLRYLAKMVMWRWTSHGIHVIIQGLNS